MRRFYQVVLPDLNAIAVFAINKDLKLVIDDHFKDIRIQPLMQSVWTHLYRRSYAGPRRKLYVYFHEKRMEVSVSNKTDSVSAIHTKLLMSMMLCIISFIYGS